MGAFVAGLRAGLLYNSFPFMGDGLVPYELFATVPWWKDLLENPVSVQFLHRLLATGTLGFCWGVWFYQRRFSLPKPLTYAFMGVGFVATLQFILGVSTLLLVVPVGLATLHQGVAFLLFGSLLYALFLLSTQAEKSS
jgi:cytochrome c oxidase assembly protein subunit 15